MARVNLSFNCGCGFKCPTLEEAVKHSDEKQHTLTAAGTVSKNKKVR